jgi:hypothetical protein
MIGQKSSPGLGLRRAWTWGGKATWRKNWTATFTKSFKGAKAGRVHGSDHLLWCGCVPLQHATTCAWGKRAAVVCARVGLDSGGGGWYQNGNVAGAHAGALVAGRVVALDNAGQTTGHCSAADLPPFIDRCPRSLIVAMSSSTGEDQRRSMCRSWSLWSTWRSRVGAEDRGAA